MATENRYDDDIIDFLERRRREFTESKTKGFTVEESMEHVKKELLLRTNLQESNFELNRDSAQGLT